jgi:hypothetical protein
VNDRPVQVGDADIRPLLRAHVAAEHALQPDTVFVEELGLCRGQVRVDLAVVNGSFHGYEIKSDRDSLRRLDTQVAVYSKVVDRATIVVGQRHLEDVRETVPSWWGIIRIDSPANRSPRLRRVRRGRRNPTIEPRALVELLWLEDALALLDGRGLARGVRGKPRRVVWDRICEHFTVDAIAREVRTRLKARAAPAEPPLQL